MLRVAGRVACAVAVSIVLLGSAEPAQGQDQQQPRQQQPEAEARRRAGLESITVTARKVEENLQTTPVAVTAFSGADLQAQSIKQLGEIAQQVPSLRWEPVPSVGANPTVTLRGLQQTNPLISADGAVGIYLDEIYTARFAGSNSHLIDIERLEVLKGPQGTLYGRNTVGGAINISSKRPTGEFGGYGRVQLGSDDLQVFEGALGFPILGETLSGRVAFQTFQHDGYHRRVPAQPGTPPSGLSIIPSRAAAQDHGAQDNQSWYGRGILRWQPSDDWDVTTLGYRFQARDHSKAPEILAKSFNVVPGSVAAAGTGRIGLALNGFDERFTGDTRTSSINVPDRDDVDAQGAGLIASYDLTDSLQIKLVTGHRDVTWRGTRDSDGTPVRGFESKVEQKSRQFTQEVQFNGSVGERFTFASGAYFLTENANNRSWSDISLPASPPAFRYFTTFSDAEAEARSYSVYGQGSYDLTERLKLSLGLRTTYERREMEIDAANSGPPFFTAFFHSPEIIFFNPSPLRRLSGIAPGGQSGIFKTCDPSDRFDAVSWLAGLDFQMTDDVMLYGKISKGFRSGAYNSIATSVVDCEPVEDEFATTYELGLKSEWLDNRVRANFAAFWTKHKDVQLSTIKPDPVSGTFPVLFFNDRSANIPGVELEVVTKLVEGLDVTGFISATWHRFKGGELDPQVAPQWLLDPENPALGNNLVPFGRQINQNTPALKYGLTARYELPQMSLAGWAYLLGVEVDYTWQSGTHASSINHPVTKNSAYGLLNGRITLELPEQNLELALFGRNLADREYFYSGIWYRNFNYLTRTYAPPRQVGVELTYRFGADAG